MNPIRGFSRKFRPSNDFLMYNKRCLLFLIFLGLLASCRSVYPTAGFDTAKIPPAPDYSMLDHWAAHPDKEDPADLTPSADYPNLQKDAPVDVFFLYPTTYTGDLRHQRDWNTADCLSTSSKTFSTTRPRGGRLNASHTRRRPSSPDAR